MTMVVTSLSELKMDLQMTVKFKFVAYPSRILTKYRNKFKHFVKETSDLYIFPYFLLRFTMRSMYL